MPQLSRSIRAEIPDTAFDHVDSTVESRLPIHHPSHVRNALARFPKVAFESPDARAATRWRLLAAAKV